MAVQNRSRRDFLRQVALLGVWGYWRRVAIVCLLQILQKNLLGAVHCDWCILN